MSAVKNAKRERALLVAFDGVDTAGKTILADSVRDALLEEPALTPIRVSIDGFHNPKEVIPPS